MDVLFPVRLKASEITYLSVSFFISASQVFAALLTCLLMSKDKGIHWQISDSSALNNRPQLSNLVFTMEFSVFLVFSQKYYYLVLSNPCFFSFFYYDFNQILLLPSSGVTYQAQQHCTLQLDESFVVHEKFFAEFQHLPTFCYYNMLPFSFKYHQEARINFTKKTSFVEILKACLRNLCWNI